MADEERLIPTVDVPEFTDEGMEYDMDYKPSIMWDFKSGDFVRTPANKIPRSCGIDAYRVWCVKAVATERYACLAYSDDIGAELEEASQEYDQDAVELAIQRTIEEALLVNPRTVSVDDFEFVWAPGEVQVSFTVDALENDSFTVAATIQIGGGVIGEQTRIYQS